MTTKAAVLQAIRHKCLDCSGDGPTEVRECPIASCALWPFRFGTDPDPSASRGFAKSPVYTGDSEARGLAGTPTPANPSPSQNGLQHAPFPESGAFVVEKEV